MKTYLKVASTVALAALLLTACSGGTGSSTNDTVPVNTPKVEEPKKEDQTKAVETLVKNVYDSLVKKEYAKVGPLFTAKQLELNKTTQEEFGQKALTKTTGGKALVYLSYNIEEIKPYDETRMLVRVKAQVTEDGKAGDSETEYMAVLENGTWKLQADTFIKKIEGIVVQEADNDWIKMKVLQADQLINGMYFKLNLKNNSSALQSPNDMYLGYKDHPLRLHLLTDKGTYTANFPDTSILPVDADGDMNVTFKGAEGKPLVVTMENTNAAYNMKKDGTAEYGQSGRSFYLEPVTPERAAQIGESLFTSVVMVELKKDKKEAEEYLTGILGGVKGEFAQTVLKNIEYNKFKEVKASYSNTKAEYNKQFGLIFFDSDAKIDYIKQDGTSEPATLHVHSEIKPNDVNGNYSYMIIEY